MTTVPLGYRKRGRPHGCRPRLRTRARAPHSKVRSAARALYMRRVSSTSAQACGQVTSRAWVRDRAHRVLGIAGHVRHTWQQRAGECAERMVSTHPPPRRCSGSMVTGVTKAIVPTVSEGGGTPACMISHAWSARRLMSLIEALRAGGGRQVSARPQSAAQCRGEAPSPRHCGARLGAPWSGKVELLHRG